MAMKMTDFLVDPNPLAPETVGWTAQCHNCGWVSDYSYAEARDHSGTCPVCKDDGVEVVCE